MRAGPADDAGLWATHQRGEAHVGRPELNHLGHWISVARVLPLPSHVAAISGVFQGQGASFLSGNGELLHTGGFSQEWHAPSNP
jgi:hypothetical protein